MIAPMLMLTACATSTPVDTTDAFCVRFPQPPLLFDNSDKVTDVTLKKMVDVILYWENACPDHAKEFMESK